MEKTYLEQYNDLIRSGGVVVGYWIRKEIGNLIADLKTPIIFTTQRRRTNE